MCQLDYWEKYFNRFTIVFLSPVHEGNIDESANLQDLVSFATGNLYGSVKALLSAFIVFILLEQGWPIKRQKIPSFKGVRWHHVQSVSGHISGAG